jgi:[ribosomal protein S5]-alanine N-acetyltransferase
VTDTERFKTERLVARSWQIIDLPLAMELWGDPAVTALIDSRGKLSDAQVEEKLRAEIERERSHGVQYWVLFDHRNGEFVGCGGLQPWVYAPGEPNFEVGFHLVKSCWGRGLATEAARGCSNMLGVNRGCRKSMPGTIRTIAPRSESQRSSDSSLLEPCSTGRRG